MTRILVPCPCGNPACTNVREASSPEETKAMRNRDALESALMSMIGPTMIDLDGLGGESKGKLSNAREAVKEWLIEVTRDTDWDDIVGNDDARNALLEAIEEPVKNARLYAHYGMKPPKGVLLYGPPGCGKTMFAKASAAAIAKLYGAKAEVLVVNGPAIQSPYIGETEKSIRNIFTYAREYQKTNKHPLIVFFDEAEVLFPDRTNRTRHVYPWEESRVSQFLSEMDGLLPLGAFVILATNRPEVIDEALLRDGRCDRKIEVKRPTRKAVEMILNKTLTGAPFAKSVKLDDLVTAGIECFFDPHYVIHSGSIIAATLSEKGVQINKETAVNFCLEHIISGAMVAGLARRAKSHAFRRDKKSSADPSGIKVDDVIASVREIFEENKELEHAFAMREFLKGLNLQGYHEKLRHTGKLQ